MSDDQKTREDIATTLADTLVEQGLTPEQTAALIGALEKMETKPSQADWTRAARLFRIQKGLSTDEPVIDCMWNTPFKLSAIKARKKLGPILALFYETIETSAAPDFAATIKSYFENGLIPPDDLLDFLGTCDPLPLPDHSQFHLIGQLLYLTASTGHRRAMWSLAWHLRVFAAHPETEPEMAENCIKTAAMWETLGLWTRLQTPNWNFPEGLSPASDRWRAATSWMENISAPLSMLLTNSRFTAGAPVIPSGLLPENKVDSSEIASETDAKPAPKTVQLLDAIGGIDDDDDESSAGLKMKPWRVLLEPMPIVGEFDPDKTYLALRQQFPWMDKANRAIGEMVAGLAAGRPRLAPLLIVGEPGIGKTSWALRVAELCKLPSTLISLSTSASSMLISGDERQWASSSPGLAAKIARETGVANPMIILDELEKAGQPAYVNSAQEALLPILDCDTGKPYFDMFLQGNMNLGHFSWLFLANSLTGISAPLLDRLTVVQARRPTSEEVERGLDAMIASWLPGETVEEAIKDQALAKYRQTSSLRDVRATIESASLKALWQAPGPREVS